ncbi:hypothetical protein PGIGA_G00169980 [Pangasianodon gigas]|uniref:Uncharacterized protein n=1 Tax=Pangasianodon gigas TaxID=30993 RepID=A0ACC5XT26_PANGG|nr:hypothetical protein [Pangasianodon gigas]
MRVWGGVAPPETGGCPFRSLTAAVGGTWNAYALEESGAKSREKSVGRFVPRGAESSFLPAVEGKYHEGPRFSRPMNGAVLCPAQLPVPWSGLCRALVPS